MAIQSPISPLALLPFLVFLSYNLYKRLTRRTTAFDKLPWIGLPKGLFAKIRARLSAAGCQKLLESSWKEYSSKNAGFIFPEFLGRGLVVLPPSQMQWILDQPDSVLSATEYHSDNLSLGQTTLDYAITKAPIHEVVIRNELTRTLGSTLEPVREELKLSFESYWSNSQEWHEVGIWDTMTKIFARTSNRIFVGSDLCRNQEFIDNVAGFAGAVPTTGIILRPFPAFMKPLLAYFACASNRRYFRVASKYLFPVIDQRKADIAKKASDPDYKFEEPFDLLQWNIRNSLKNPDPREWTTELISKRYMATSFAAVHTTALTTSNTLYDLASAKPELQAFETIEEEVLRVYKESQYTWTKASLAKLVRLDSAIRESMRLGNNGGFALGRKVVAKDGATTTDGMYLPHGTHVAMHSYGIQKMDGYYENAEKYDPFRFSRPRESMSLSGGSDGDVLKERNLASVATSPSHLVFGHGRHACPGRFFAIFEVKLMLAHLILNYDIKPVPKRPSNMWIHDLQVVNTTAKLAIRKKAVPLAS